MTRPDWFDPDPLYVEPEPLDPRVPEPPMSPRTKGCIWAAGIGASWAAVILIVLALLAAVSAPRETSNEVPKVEGRTLQAAGQASTSLGAPHSAPLPVVPSGIREPIPSVPAPTGGIGTVLIGGTLSYVGAKYGPTYLALPFPRGTVATICGAGGCVTRRSTDYGPDQRVHPNRIADLSAADFVFVCGLPLSAGLCKGTVELEPPVHEADDRMRAEDRPGVTLPPTDLEAQP